MENKDIKHFEILNAIDVNDKTEKKNNGSKDLTYLSWAWAWAEVKKKYPSAYYEIEKFGENKLPYVFDEKTGYMVFTRVEIEGIEHEMWLPVMDNSNKAMLDRPYTYKVKEYSYGKFTGNYIDKSVEPATMFDINKTIMRCLTKNLAMFGLGLYIYAGEDLPENSDEFALNNDPKKETKKEIKATEKQLEILKNVYTGENLTKLLQLNKIEKIEDLSVQKASALIKKINEKKENK